MSFIGDQFKNLNYRDIPLPDYIGLPERRHLKKRMTQRMTVYFFADNEELPCDGFSLRIDSWVLNSHRRITLYFKEITIRMI